MHCRCCIVRFKETPVFVEMLKPAFALACAAALTCSPCVAGEVDNLEDVDEATVAATAPLPTLLPERLREESLRYRLVVALSENQRMTGEATFTIAKAKLERDGETEDVWRIERSDSGVLPIDRTFVLRRSDLAMMERHVIISGEEAFRLRFSGSTVSPEGAEDEAIELAQPVLPSWDVAILALPLAEGYETLARTFDVVQMTLHWKVAVLGAETARAPAGTFDTYKVAITCLDNDALSRTTWVTKSAPYRIVREEAPISPQMPIGRVVRDLAQIDVASESPSGPADGDDR